MMMMMMMIATDESYPGPGNIAAQRWLTPPP